MVISILQTAFLSLLRMIALGLHPFVPSVAQLVNNAGIAYKGATFGAEEAKITIDCNYKGITICAFAYWRQMRCSTVLIPVVSTRTLLVAGTMRITDALMPYIRSSADGRVIK